MVDRQDIIDAAREFIGTPWHHQGRLKGVGVDCVGLISLVSKQLSIPINDYTTYSRYPIGDRLLGELEAGGLSRVEEPHVGSVLVFWLERPSKPQHTAFLTDKGILHAWYTARKVVEHSLTEWWTEHVHSYWDLPGVREWQLSS